MTGVETKRSLIVPALNGCQVVESGHSLKPLECQFARYTVKLCTSLNVGQIRPLVLLGRRGDFD
jgi:hypothetical protein